MHLHKQRDKNTIELERGPRTMLSFFFFSFLIQTELQFKPIISKEKLSLPGPPVPEVPLRGSVPQPTVTQDFGN